MDMASYASMQNFAAGVNSKLDRGNIFVANAVRDTLDVLHGRGHRVNNHSQCRFDVFATELVMPKLRPRQLNAKSDPDQYAISKLLEVVVVRPFAEDHPAWVFSVTVNCINTGLCHTETARDHPTGGFCFIKLILTRSTEAGSRTLVHARAQRADSPSQYFSDCTIAARAPLNTSKEGKKA